MYLSLFHRSLIAILVKFDLRNLGLDSEDFLLRNGFHENPLVEKIHSQDSLDLGVMPDNTLVEPSNNDTQFSNLHSALEAAFSIKKRDEVQDPETVLLCRSQNKNVPVELRDVQRKSTQKYLRRKNHSWNPLIQTLQNNSQIVNRNRKIINI